MNSNSQPHQTTSNIFSLLAGPRAVQGTIVKQSDLFTKTKREAPSEEVSFNSQLLTRAGYISRLGAGIYSFLPLGNRVLYKIEGIVREEIKTLGAHEILMPALHPKENWERTGRWTKLDVLFKLKGAGDRDFALGATHEEIVTPLLQSFVGSYRDLPTAVFQIQTKFRNEARAKSGLLRGREFRMKDLYSFHLEQSDLDQYYERATALYEKIFIRCGIGEKTYCTTASGGSFSRYSHEFQTVTEHGEDTIYLLPGTKRAINKEIIADTDALREILPAGVSVGDLQERKAIEVGNIFKLGTRFSDAFDFQVTGSDGKQHPILMGCYGLGPSRVMGTVVECLSDSKGLVWPKEIAPFNIHLLSLHSTDDEQRVANDLAAKMCRAGFEVLYDDRSDATAGEKFSDSDLLGIPIRVVVSKRSLAAGGVEVKERSAAVGSICSID